MCITYVYGKYIYIYISYDKDYVNKYDLFVNKYKYIHEVINVSFRCKQIYQRYRDHVRKEDDYMVENLLDGNQPYSNIGEYSEIHRTGILCVIT